MEKIYMEDSSNSQSSQSSQSSNKDYKRQFKISVILSFVVAFFAIYSLIACGISQVSYAAPTDGIGSGTEASEIKFYDSDNSVVVNAGTGNAFNVPVYYTTVNENNVSIFCVEPQADIPTIYSGDSTDNSYVIDYYLTDNNAVNYGLLTMLDKFYNEDGSDVDLFTTMSELSSYDTTVLAGNERAILNSFIKQASVWLYMTEKLGGPVDDGSDLNRLTSTEYSALTGSNGTLLIKIGTSSSHSLPSNTAIFTAIRSLVNQAKNASSYFSVKLNVLSELSKRDDGDYQIGYSIANTPNSLEVNSYDISVVDSSNNEVLSSSNYRIVDAEGNTIENNKIICNSGSACINQFYVIISKDYISEKNKTYEFNVGISANVKTFKGAVYRNVLDSDSVHLQKIVTVTGTSRDVSSGASFQIVTSEDTGMTTAQTIYFIGLVVLLCGIGIVYANAKPAESKQ